MQNNAFQMFQALNRPQNTDPTAKFGQTSWMAVVSSGSQLARQDPEPGLLAPCRWIKNRDLGMFCEFFFITPILFLKLNTSLSELFFPGELTSG